MSIELPGNLRRIRHAIKAPSEDFPFDPSPYGRDNLDKLASKLLQLAGFSPFSPFENLVGKAGLQRCPRRLRTYGADNRQSGRLALLATLYNGKKDGPIDRITRRACTYLGHHQVEYVTASVADLPGLLQARDIDFIAPFWIQTPWRMSEVRLSRPVPGIAIGIGVVVHKQFAAVLDRIITHNTESLSDVEIVTTRGESSTRFLSLLLGETIADVTKVAGLDEAIDLVRKQPQNPQTEKTRIFIGDEVTVNFFQHKYSHDLIARGSDEFDPEGFSDRFPIGFAVHWDEPLLAEALNRCIATMNRNGFLAHAFREIHGNLKSLNCRTRTKSNANESHRLLRSLKYL